MLAVVPLQGIVHTEVCAWEGCCYLLAPLQQRLILVLRGQRNGQTGSQPDSRVIKRLV